MDTTTKLAIGAGVGFLALVGAVALFSRDAGASTPTPAALATVQPGRTYRFGLLDSGSLSTADVQKFVSAAGWQVQSFESLGAVATGAGAANGYLVTAIWAGNAVDLSSGTSALDAWDVGLSTSGTIAVTHIQGPL